MSADESRPLSDRVAELEGRLAAALAENEALKLYRALIERAWTATWLIDANGRVKYVSPSRLAMRGVESSNDLQSIFERVPPEHLESARRALAEVLASPPNRPVFYELSGVDAEGKPWGREMVLLNRLDDPDLRGIVVSGHDTGPPNAARFALRTAYERLALSVDDQRAAQLALRRRAEREELLRALSRRLLDDEDTAFVASLETVGRMLEAAWVGLYMVSFGTSLRLASAWSHDGRSPPDTLADDSPGIRGALAVASVGHGNRRIGALVMSAGGSASWAAEDIRWLEAVAELLGVAQTRRETADALARANDDARAASRAKSAFLVAMSHELRSPLHGVIGMVDLLGATTLDERQRRYVDIARGAARGLLSVINDVLDLSKIEAGKLDLESVELAVQDVVDEACGVFELQAEENGTELVCSVERLPRVVGDPGRLRQVVMNLVGNAIKFTNRGEVRVRAFATTREATSVRLRIEVRDTGIGVPVAETQRIFAPFAQLDAARYGGTGLGLTISRELVSRMGGTIGVESNAGRGSTFWIEMPLTCVPEPPAASARLDARGHVLVVAGSAEVRSVLTDVLTAKGFAVSALEVDGPIDQAVAAKRSAVAIVVDGIAADGRRAAARLAGDERFLATRLLFVETLTRPLRDEEVSALRVAARCPAPVWSRRLEATLEAVLQGEGKPAGAPGGVPGSLAHVLVIDDSEINAEVTSEVLRNAGYRVDVAFDGEEGIAKIVKHGYGLALVDCLMPGIDGYETARTIRRLERDGVLAGRPPLPMVALTASATSGDRERALEAGMNEHLTKPFESTRLLQVVAEHLRAPSTASIDLSRALARLGGDAGVLDRALRRFVELAPETHRLLETGVTARDERAVRFAAHRLRGQASMFDAADLVAAIEALEHVLGRADWAAVDAALGRAELVLWDTVRELSKRAEAPAATP